MASKQPTAPVQAAAIPSLLYSRRWQTEFGYATNLKFVEEKIRIHKYLRPTPATPNQVQLDLRTMVLRVRGSHPDRRQALGPA